MTSAALSPCGRLLAAGGADGLVRVWLWEEGRMVASFGQQAGEGGAGRAGPPPTALLWALDGRMLVSAGREAEATVWRTDACYDARAARY